MNYVVCTESQASTVTQTSFCQGCPEMLVMARAVFCHVHTYGCPTSCRRPTLKPSQDDSPESESRSTILGLSISVRDCPKVEYRL